MYLALDRETNDLILKEGGGIERVAQGRYSVQQVRCALQTTLGEYYPVPDSGWLHLEDFVRNPDLYGIETRAREAILGTEGVDSITSLSIRREQRTYILSFEAKSRYGVINETVPWTIGV
jgi:hypothetical protein